MTAVKLYHIELVRDRDIPISPGTMVERAAQVFHELLDHSPVEQLAVIHVDANGAFVGVEKVGMGTLTNVIISMGEIFRGALIAAVPSIILGHNHPPGDPTPSTPDWDMTDKARALGTQLGIHVADHIVVAPHGRHVSMRTMDMEATQESVMKDAMRMLGDLSSQEKSLIMDRLRGLNVPLDPPRGLHVDPDGYKYHKPFPPINKENDETEQEVRGAFPPGTFIGDSIFGKKN
jgi:DNA repair protein RadC